MNTSYAPRLAVALGLAALIFAPQHSHAATVTVMTSWQITSSDFTDIFGPGETIFAGDTFDITFTFDDAVTDTNALANDGSFPGALTSFSMTPGASNTGTWDPSAGVLTNNRIGTNSRTTFPPLGDFFQFSSGGTGFPDLQVPRASTNTFNSLEIRFIGPAGSFLTDTGTGQTLADVISPGLPSTLGGTLKIDAGTFVLDSASGTLTSMSVSTATVVPVPAGVWLGMTLLTGLGGVRIIKNRREQRRA